METVAPREQAEIRPKKTGIWVGVGLIVLGIVAFGAMLGVGLANLFGDLNDYERVEPGTSEVLELASGDYLVFTEGTSSSVVSVVGDSGPVDLAKPTTTSSFSADGSQWTAGLSFTIDSAGSYEVTSEGPGRIAVGPPFAGKIVSTVLMPILVGFVLTAIGIGLIVWTVLKRSKAKRQLAAGQATSH